MLYEHFGRSLAPQTIRATFKVVPPTKERPIAEKVKYMTYMRERELLEKKLTEEAARGWITSVFNNRYRN